MSMLAWQTCRIGRSGKGQGPALEHGGDRGRHGGGHEEASNDPMFAGMHEPSIGEKIKLRQG
jgi:hypothetical protein